ncbi:DUF1573 domain-containing protein [Vallitalea pronyensis]|uniref:DUF1573 domain-containing protein n=1 Tax=Vallitalea pronyensis TaxID=1348613 RepID=A0A8J8SHY7_9FIRM|nr:DUF1573 domain-containing protein [Vallitalea pronyensis]QUI24355.1 DUF1573 domain-containing protein [Vallitalea pronyensis]
MSDPSHTITDEFQCTVKENDCFNKNILEQLAKLQEAAAKVNKSIIRACTYCGCIEINANNKLYSYHDDINLDMIKLLDPHHISGELCDACRDRIEKDMGSCLYYLACISNSFDLNLDDVLLKEMDIIHLLGKFHIE